MQNRTKLNLAETIAQYKIIDFIYSNFNYNAIETERLRIYLVDRCHIRLVDEDNNKITFSYDENTKKISWED